MRMSGISVSGGRGATIIVARSKVYKIYVGYNARRRLEIEVTGNKLIRKEFCFADVIVPIHRSRFVPNALVMQRGSPVYKSSTKEIRMFVRDLYRKAYAESVYGAAISIFGDRVLAPEVVAGDWEGIGDRVQSVLSSLRIPIGPMHGDIHLGNIVEIDGAYKLIDCNRARRSGSPIIDVVHYVVENEVSCHHAQWVDRLGSSTCRSITEELTCSDYGRWESYVMLYALWRISAEISSLKLRRRLSPNRIKKYRNAVAKYVLHVT